MPVRFCARSRRRQVTSLAEFLQACARASIQAAINSQKAAEFYTSTISTSSPSSMPSSEMTRASKIIRQAIALGAQCGARNLPRKHARWRAQRLRGRPVHAAALSAVHADAGPERRVCRRFQTVCNDCASRVRDQRAQRPAQDDMLECGKPWPRFPVHQATMDSVTGPSMVRGCHETTLMSSSRRGSSRGRLHGGRPSALPPKRAGASGAFWLIVARALGCHRHRHLVCRALDHASGRAVGRYDDDARTRAINDIEVPGADRGDELGHMARAVLVFRDAAVEKVPPRGRNPPMRRRRPRWSVSATRRRRPLPRRRSSTSWSARRRA